MNEEQKAGLAKITARIRIKHWSQCGITSDDGEWLLALVKELEEENAQLEVSKAEWVKIGSNAAWSMAEQQLAAVTAEHDRRVGDLQRMTGERDELKREVERLRTGQSTMRTRIDIEIARAEKAEAERDALKDDIARLHEAIEEDARELARLRGGT